MQFLMHHLSIGYDEIAGTLNFIDMIEVFKLVYNCYDLESAVKLNFSTLSKAKTAQTYMPLQFKKIFILFHSR